jgi:hypothetical protein
MPENKRGRLVQGHEIRYQAEGDGWMKNKTHGWAPPGQLPEEWDQVRADPTVEKAVIFRNHQRDVRADKRRIEDRYEREEQS